MPRRPLKMALESAQATRPYRHGSSRRTKSCKSRGRCASCCPAPPESVLATSAKAPPVGGRALALVQQTTGLTLGRGGHDVGDHDLVALLFAGDRHLGLSALLADVLLGELVALLVELVLLVALEQDEIAAVL